MKAKRFLALILILAMLASLNAVFALNVRADDDAVKETENGPDLAAIFEGFADDLKALGLFLGTDSGYELDRAPTRDEAATMLVRLLGKETEAKEKNGAHPFTDVPRWADPYVGYLYENSLTKGISDDLFGSKELCNAQMFCTFVLRALGYSDTGDVTDFTYDGAVGFAVETGLVSEELLAYSALEFTRAGCVYIMREALLTNLKNTELPLLAKLVEDGAVSEEAAMMFFARAAGSEESKEDEDISEGDKEDKEEAETGEKDEAETEEENESAENITKEEMDAFIKILGNGILFGSFESNVELQVLLGLVSYLTTDYSIKEAVKEVIEDDEILWTIVIESETVEALIVVFFDSEGNFLELDAVGERLDIEDDIFAITITPK
ncbi:MAG: hypothetical protein FWD23_02705 [Oscillospiraceae bacterium]|nr:hypothetical protein [Oscillospiraceae bacterium]